MGNSCCCGSGIKNFHEEQDYKKLKSGLRSDGALFEDPLFPASNRLLTRSTGAMFSYRGSGWAGGSQNIEWLRPHEICERQGKGLQPQMEVGQRDRFDINQGEIGDCWFLAPLASLAENEHYFAKVVPPGQDFRNKYQGIFRFRFYRFGDWYEVVVDDRLPTRNGRLIFLRAKEDNEFWSPLLEKAYAKFYGSYAAIEGGLSMDAAVDFTGGIPQLLSLDSYNTEAELNKLFHLLHSSHMNGALVAVSLGVRHRQEGESMGLQAQHAYSVTGVHCVRAGSIFRRTSIPLIRLRNPHGDAKEWSGDWSDNSEQWSAISRRMKKNLNLQKNDDGEFYMNFNRDFMKYFGKMEIVSLNPVRMKLNEKRLSRKFNLFSLSGEWKVGETAGGTSSFEMNPQFQFKLWNKRDHGYSTGVVVVSLAQEAEVREKELLSIGFRVYKLADEHGEGEELTARFVNNAVHVVHTSGAYINSREVSLSLELEQGSYCVMPSTFTRGQQGLFCLRLFVDSRWGCDVTRGDLVHKETIRDFESCFTCCGSLVNCLRALCCCRAGVCCSCSCCRASQEEEAGGQRMTEIRIDRVDAANIREEGEGWAGAYQWGRTREQEMDILKNIINDMEGKTYE